ncbi:MAG: sugar phosphate isomerase/epimerase [Pedosphaera sp.]|nr:sugar phosphate isomerase/epimerase [Pedosphaera sp.]
MKLKLACADFSFPLLPQDHVFDLIAMLDVQGVDLGLFEERSHLWPSKVFRHIARSAVALSKKLKDRGLHLADVFLQPASDFVTLAANHTNPKRRKKARDLFLRTLEFSARCGGNHVTTLPGIHCPDESRADSLARCSDELAWRVEQARSHGITFSVEAHIGSIVPTPQEAAQLVTMTPGLTLTLDYTHFTRNGLADARIEPLIQHASHFHARCACRGRLQASFKQNTIDYARILRVMKTTGYRGWVGIEYVWIDWEHCNEVDNLSEAILLRDFLRSVKL